MNISYVSGFFDADGYVTLTKKNKSDIAKTPLIGFTNTDLNLLQTVQSFFLQEYGIKGHIKTKAPSKENHTRGYDLAYSRDSALKVAKLMLAHCYHTKKVFRLSHLLCCYKTAVPRNGKYTEEKLKELQLFEETFFQAA